MAAGELLHEAPAVRPVRWRWAARRHAWVLLGIIMLMVLTAVLANVHTPYSPVDIALPDWLRPVMRKNRTFPFFGSPGE
jgi:hypothetical protein